MLIEFRCGNFLAFDSATGKHAVCGQKLSAAAEDAGLVVTCPKCQQDCQVPPPRSGQTGGQGSAAATERKTQPSSPQPSSQLAGRGRSRSNRCPKCGGRLNERGACRACRWVRPQHPKAQQRLDELQMEPAGMMLWFSSIISEGVPAKIFCLAAIAMFSFLFCALMAFSIFVLGGFLGGLLFLLSFLALLLFVGMTFKGYQFLRDGNAELAWFQRPFWYGILAICRNRRWEGGDRKLKNRNVLVLRGGSVDDQVLAKHEELQSAEVLDLQGTSITDEAIRLLYHHKNLQCLVVRDTMVSHAAVTRLQQSFPKLWIWH